MLKSKTYETVYLVVAQRLRDKWPCARPYHCEPCEDADSCLASRIMRNAIQVHKDKPLRVVFTVAVSKTKRRLLSWEAAYK